LQSANAASEVDLQKIFEGKAQEVVQAIATYANTEASQIEAHLKNIANEALKLFIESAGANSTPEAFQTSINNQRHNILVYLPPALNMGNILDINTIDDRTNKMEGPISNLMHGLESAFSGGEK